MKKIAVTQRVTHIDSYGESRDSLDQRWISFLWECSLLPVLIPNHRVVAEQIVKSIKIDGILLTGGNDLRAYGGDAPERDETEEFLLSYAIENSIPLLGVCRGMQFIQHIFGTKLERVLGHVQEKQINIVNGELREVNSYHSWGTKEVTDSFICIARSKDGIVKGIKHCRHKLYGIMWHPERFSFFHEEDISFFQEFYGSGG